MGSYSKKYKSPYDTKTYEDIKNTYLWIRGICEKLDFSEFKSEFLYDIGDITCCSDSYEEFQKEAFGQK
ncbi:MAG: hypothetical protein FWE04_06330 [Oscillospiraceae bacterium]|nr:hypothetical protein [Oscillospiraceae bacterium]